jgi:hypothetical protein
VGGGGTVGEAPPPHPAASNSGNSAIRDLMDRPD